jgi:hypothetical protein
MREARNPGKIGGERISKGCRMSPIKRLLRLLAHGYKFDKILVCCSQLYTGRLQM